MPDSCWSPLSRTAVFGQSPDRRDLGIANCRHGGVAMDRAASPPEPMAFYKCRQNSSATKPSSIWGVVYGRSRKGSSGGR